MVPGLLYLLINNYIPMVGILLAFKKIDYTVGIFNSPWCGFDNFRYLFSSRTAWIITRNTLLYNLAFIVIGIVTGMIVGICLFAVTKKAVQTFFQTSILLPQLISMIVVAYIVYAFLSNEAYFINKSILGGTDVNFYGETGCGPSCWCSSTTGSRSAITPLSSCPPSWASTGGSMRRPRWTGAAPGSRSPRSPSPAQAHHHHSDAAPGGAGVLL